MVESLKLLIEENLQAQKVEIIDQSGYHAGHAGAAESGGGHFRMLVVADCFGGKSLVERHRMVYDSVESIRHQIHALSMKTVTPEEWRRLR